MHMPVSPKLILAAFPTWPYDPEELQEPPCCLHTGPELRNLIPQLFDNYSSSVPPAEVMEQTKVQKTARLFISWWCKTHGNSLRQLVKIPEGYSHSRTFLVPASQRLSAIHTCICQPFIILPFPQPMTRVSVD